MAGPGSSWLPVAADSDFPIQNIPFGVVLPAGSEEARCATRVGDTVVDLRALARAGLFDVAYARSLEASTLNDFMAAGQGAWRDARSRLQALLAEPSFADANAALRDDAALRAAALLPLASVVPQLPAHIGDYTDFYSSREHATNVGIMFRGVANALQPNWCVSAGAGRAPWRCARRASRVHPVPLPCICAGCTCPLGTMAAPPPSSSRAPTLSGRVASCR